MKEYTYIIARIRSLETQLMTAQELDQLIAAPSAADAEKALRDRRRGTDGLWELLIDAEAEHITAFLRMPIDYHNIKAAIKAVFSDTDAEELLLDNGSVDKDVIYESVKKREYNELPDALAETAQAAMTALLRTQDGQICDIITDKAQLAAMEDIAKSSGDMFLARYAQMLADTVNLKTAMRCAAAERSEDFIENALYAGGSLDIPALIKAAAEGMAAVREYISATVYADADTSGIPVFERYCRDKLTELCREAKYDSFSSAPILAYDHAKQTELDAVRLVIEAKRSRIADDVIRERVPMLYE